jgi:hypothetical protein
VNKKENITLLTIGLIATRAVLLADVIATPVLMTIYNKIGFCYGGLGVLLASGGVDMYLSDRIRKIKNQDNK